jgi:hypothetical protein
MWTVDDYQGFVQIFCFHLQNMKQQGVAQWMSSHANKDWKDNATDEM